MLTYMGKGLLLSCIWVSLCGLVQAQDKPEGEVVFAQVQSEYPAKKTIALVLGGGGARGAAHIGVLEVLEQEHIPIDCLVGTSMGALVAGSYAAGLSPKPCVRS